MTFQERKKIIVSAVYEAGSLSVFELAEVLGTSPATIRRDLHEISEDGLLIRTHGGAMKPESQVVTSFAGKKDQFDNRKRMIGEAAASYVQDGDTIFMDCGSTVFQMCAHLKKKVNIRIITNSLPVIAELIDIPSIRINLVGGELDKSRKAVHGEKAIQHVNSYHAAKAFIGVDGISPENGLTAHSEAESSITTAYIKNADNVFLLCDSSKIGRNSYIKFAALNEVSCLVTDDQLDKHAVRSLKENGIGEIVAVSLALQAF
ncbi:DeoR/GlpR family DNA-binding transcription regulator [Dyadobacter aurulentus]|uniref:DeoR/GlpR family DNA-binding transcription regulator n=1 Tax=Dyadobacter sp. UC 10 TaxID=2605428 RepID=UPI0011F17138|nr:DeoR/GlpR family DNA-binding transcription regulator [Dyadobacter sp. UC 10]KAA0992900.1 DeoR/GlpR transcriptional regulator [Dyadobacter sp. UC 10]